MHELCQLFQVLQPCACDPMPMHIAQAWTVPSKERLYTRSSGLLLTSYKTRIFLAMLTGMPYLEYRLEI